MPHFFRRLEVGTRSLTFYFNRIFTAGDRCYHVSVMDANNKLQVFHMEQRGERWLMADPQTCLHWILNMEAVLAKEIANHVESNAS